MLKYVKFYIRLLFIKIMYIHLCHINIKLKIMTKQQIEQEMKDLYVAMKSKLLSVNDYCTMYHNLAQKLKQL